MGNLKGLFDVLRLSISKLQHTGIRIFGRRLNALEVGLKTSRIVDGQSLAANIAESFALKYGHIYIYTSVSYDSEDTMLHSIRRELNMRIINDGYDSVLLVTAVDVNAFIS